MNYFRVFVLIFNNEVVGGLKKGLVA